LDIREAKNSNVLQERSMESTRVGSVNCFFRFSACHALFH
jgi:hypothetical protein